MKEIWLVEAGHDYEGSEIIYVASTKEKAELWLKEHFVQEPTLTLKNRDKLLGNWKSLINEHYGYDYIYILPKEIDS